MKTEKLYFKTNSQEARVDRENGEILGVSLISTPEALSHGYKIDKATIESFFRAVEGKQITAYITHEGNDSPLDSVGIWDNFSILEDEDAVKLVGDFSALNSWKEGKDADAYNTLFELAELAPETFGVSAECYCYGVIYEDGEELKYEGQEEVEQIWLRAESVSAFSIVSSPSANPSGLFSEKEEEDNEKLHVELPEADWNGKILDPSTDESEEDLEEVTPDYVEFIEYNLTQKEEEVETLKDLAKELQAQVETIKASLEEVSEESAKWKASYLEIKESGFQPSEDLVPQENLSLIQQIENTSNWGEKSKLVNNNFEEFCKYVARGN